MKTTFKYEVGEHSFDATLHCVHQKATTMALHHLIIQWYSSHYEFFVSFAIDCFQQVRIVRIDLVLEEKKMRVLQVSFQPYIMKNSL